MLDRTTIARVLYAVSTRRRDPRPADPQGVRPRLRRPGGAARDDPRPPATGFSRGSSATPARMRDSTRTSSTSATARPSTSASAGPRLADNPLFAYFLSAVRVAAPQVAPLHFPVYHRRLERYRGRPVRVLEIGVYRGGGLTMRLAEVLRAGRGHRGRRHRRRRGPGDQGPVRGPALGDQADPRSLRGLHETYGPFDVVIDDGGHTMQQQIVTAETLFPLLKDDGLLIVEDTHTSYWPSFGGGLGEPGAFLTWARDRVDDLHSQHHQSLDRSSVWARESGSACTSTTPSSSSTASGGSAFNEVVGGASYILADQFSERIAVESSAERERVREEWRRCGTRTSGWRPSWRRRGRGRRRHGDGGAGRAGGPRPAASPQRAGRPAARLESAARLDADSPSWRGSTSGWHGARSGSPRVRSTGVSSRGRPWRVTNPLRAAVRACVAADPAVAASPGSRPTRQA